MLRLRGAATRASRRVGNVFLSRRGQVKRVMVQTGAVTGIRAPGSQAVFVPQQRWASTAADQEGLLKAAQEAILSPAVINKRVLRSFLFIPGNQPKKLSKLRTMEVLPDAVIPDLEDSVGMTHKSEAIQTMVAWLNSDWAEIVTQFGTDEELKRQNDAALKKWEKDGNKAEDFVPKQFIDVPKTGSLAQTRTKGLVSPSLPMMLPRVNFTTTAEGRSVEHPAEDGRALWHKEVGQLCGQAGPLIDGFVFGKVETADEVRAIDRALVNYEMKHGIEEGTFVIVPTIETPLGVLNALQICLASPRVIGVAFGHDDYCAAMETHGVVDCTRFARNMIAVSASAGKVQAFDSPFTSFKDTVGLADETRFVRELGFDGKCCIHPSQVAIVHREFGVAEKRYDWASRAINAFNESVTKNGQAAVAIDEAMVDVPVYKRAQKLFSRENERRGYDKERSQRTLELRQKAIEAVAAAAASPLPIEPLTGTTGAASAEQK